MVGSFDVRGASSRWRAQLGAVAAAVVFAALAATEARAAQTNISISTTAPPATPQILGSSMVAAVPASPFLYTLAATGQKPLTFAATGLPAGLTLATSTGTISGTTPAAGSYPVTVTVSNAQGNAQETLNLVSGGPLSRTPVMGWNSYDSFGATVTESEVMAAAQGMSAQLQPFGWNTVVVDYLWFDNEQLTDANGRYLPSPSRFPSATGTLGFKPLADKIHALGLSFGIHIMRGIPRKSVSANSPIAGSSYTATQAADTSTADDCPWDTHMWAVHGDTAAGQAWYDSIFAQYAQWGIDFVKVDDLLNNQVTPLLYHQAEVDAIRKSIDKTGRSIVFSLSPGPMRTADAADLNASGNMWRMVNDFWDKDGLSTLSDVFTAAGNWQAVSTLTVGHWPDADMLPLGYIGPRSPVGGASRPSALSHNQQVAVMSLWSILPSPLIFGGNVPDLTTDATGPFTIALLTNPEVLAVNQDASGTRAKRVSLQGNTEVWARAISGGRTAVALFNHGTADTTVSATFSQLSVTGTPVVRDLWQRTTVSGMTTGISVNVPDGGALLYLLSPPASETGGAGGAGAGGSASGGGATAAGGSSGQGVATGGGSSGSAGFADGGGDASGTVASGSGGTPATAGASTGTEPGTGGSSSLGGSGEPASGGASSAGCACAVNTGRKSNLPGGLLLVGALATALMRRRRGKSALVATALALVAAPAAAAPQPLINYFQPMPIIGKLSTTVWGASAVGARDPANGLEDNGANGGVNPGQETYFYWDGKIIKGGGRQISYVHASHWLHSIGFGPPGGGSTGWETSIPMQAVSDNVMGPYVSQGNCYTKNQEGNDEGHNVTAVVAPTGTSPYTLSVGEIVPGQMFSSSSANGPWTPLGLVKTNNNGHSSCGSLSSNFTLTLGADNRFWATSRGGCVMDSDQVLGTYKVETDSILPNLEKNDNGDAEDEVIWYSGGYFHIVYNYWNVQRGYHIMSKDGVTNWMSTGLAYQGTQSPQNSNSKWLRYTDGTVNQWHNMERGGVYLENGHVTHFTFAVTDTDKNTSAVNGGGSKVLVVPFNGVQFDCDNGDAASCAEIAAGGAGGAGGSGAGGAAGSGGATGGGGGMAAGGAGGVAQAGGISGVSGTGPGSGAAASVGGQGNGGAANLGSGGAAAGTGGNAAPSAEAGSSGSTDSSANDNGGCGCRVGSASGRGASAALLLLAGLIGAVRRRSRRRA